MTQTLRIALVTDAPAYGGAEAYLQLMASALSEQGHRVRVVMASTPALSVMQAKLAGTGLPVDELEIAEDGAPGLTRLGRLLRYFRENKTDVAHYVLRYPLAMASLLPAAALAGVPVRLVTDQLVFAHGPVPAKDRLKKRLGCLAVDACIAVSQENKACLVNAFGVPGRRISVIHNGVPDLSLSPTEAEEARRRLRSEWGAAGDRCVVGTVARLSPQKGIFDLLDAAAAVRQQGPQVLFLVVGDGELRPEVEAGIRDRRLEGTVRLLGFRQDIGAILSALDLFMLPSHMEGLPLSVAEAMSASLPVVATAVSGTPEMVVSGETGLLVSPRCPAQLAEAVLSLAGDPRRAAAMGEAGRERFVTMFRSDVMLARTLALYADLARRKGLSS